MSKPVETPQPTDQQTRLNVIINEDTAGILKEFKTKKGTSMTEVIRRAVALYYLAHQEVTNKGTIQLVSADGTVRELILLP